jgi:hypothetical protein
VAANILCSVRPKLANVQTWTSSPRLSRHSTKHVARGQARIAQWARTPSNCPNDCANVLLPVRDACSDYLKDSGALFKTLIDSTVHQCASLPPSPAPEPVPGPAMSCEEEMVVLAAPMQSVCCARRRPAMGPMGRHPPSAWWGL